MMTWERYILASERGLLPHNVFRYLLLEIHLSGWEDGLIFVVALFEGRLRKLVLLYLI